MILRYYSELGGQPIVVRVRGSRIRMGRNPANDIVLDCPFIDESAVTLQRIEDRWKINVAAINGLETGGQKLNQGDSVWWDGRSALRLFPYVFQLRETPQATVTTEQRYTAQIHHLVKAVHLELLHLMHHDGAEESTPQTLESLLQIERAIEAAAGHQGILAAENHAVALELAGTCVRDQILAEFLDQTDAPPVIMEQATVPWNLLATAVDARETELQQWVQTCTRQLMAAAKGDQLQTRIDCVEQEFWGLWDRLKNRLTHSLCEYLVMRQLKKQVKDTLFGFGPLEDLLRLPTVTEIMVNASDEIYVEKNGVLQNSARQFVSDEVTHTVIERIVSAVGRRIDTSQPMVDARLPDGSRVNAVIPPLAVKGPCLTIRKFAKQRLTMDKLVELGSLSPSVVEFLQACVRSKRSILISGGTGTGKTTLLNCLSQAIPTHERIICIEDTHELQLDHPHKLFLECRNSNSEGKGTVTIRDLLRNALRQRPDRLIIGECRGPESLDMLQAMNTGHDGSMTTLHANHPQDALQRLEILVRSDGMEGEAVRRQIVSAIDIIVQLTRMPDGRRCVAEVAEVTGIAPTTGQIRISTLFATVTDGPQPTARLCPTGSIPSFVGELVRDKYLQLDLFLCDIGSFASCPAEYVGCSPTA